MPSNYKTFQFTADVIDGKILQFPQVFNLQCSCVKPLGCDIVRQFNKTECIVAKKVFLIYCGGQVFGSVQFSGVAQFVQYLNNACQILPLVPSCNIVLNGCNLTLNGCNLTLKEYVSCNILLGGCQLNLNGCALTS